MDSIYVNFARRIAGGKLADGESLQADAERESARNALRKRFAALSRKSRAEKRFNRQAEINRVSREVKAELDALDY